MSEIDKWVDPINITAKGCPIHARGAIYHNHLLKKKGLDKIYEPIKNGAKVKYTYMKVPNPIGSNVISFEGYLPKEFGLESYIDHNKQFEKSFRDPLKMFTDAIGWNLEKINTLEQFFG